MSNKPDTSRTYELSWNYEPRLLEEHFGKNKYSSTTKALCELVANAFDAGASTVDVEVVANDLGGVNAIIVSDNGQGISPLDLEKRFVVVGVNPGSRSSRSSFGRFGVGRLAVFRIGSVSQWTSVSKSPKGNRKKIQFELRSGADDLLKVREESSDDPAGTRIEIWNILDSGQLTPTA